VYSLRVVPCGVDLALFAPYIYVVVRSASSSSQKRELFPSLGSSLENVYFHDLFVLVSKCIHTEFVVVVGFRTGVVVVVVFPYTAACAVALGTIVFAVDSSSSRSSFLSSSEEVVVVLLVDIGSFRFSTDRRGLVLLVSTTDSAVADSVGAVAVLVHAGVVVVVDDASAASADSSAGFVSAGFVSVVFA
jgi:hypothetical protein